MARGIKISIAIVIDPFTRKILLLETNLEGRDPHEFPGGKVEEGESYLEAAIRELKEETGLDAIFLPDPIHSYGPTSMVLLGIAKEQAVKLNPALHIGAGWYLRPGDVPLSPGRKLPDEYKGKFPPESLYKEFALANAALDKYLEMLSS